MSDVERAVYEATREQYALVAAHVVRVRERRDRFSMLDMAFALADVELKHWMAVREILKANLTGKIVPPS